MAWIEIIDSPLNFTTRGDMIDSTELVPSGIEATVFNEQYNQYVKDTAVPDGGTGKWIVRAGNRYATENIPTADDFKIYTNTQIIDSTTGDLLYYNGTAFVVFSGGGSGTGSINYADRTALLAAAAGDLVVGQLATIVGTEPGNRYMRNASNNKWIVVSGNIYTTATLPDGAIFDIPSGTVIYNTTTSQQVFW